MSTPTTPTTLSDVVFDVRATPAHGRLTLSAAGEIGDGVRCRADVRHHEIVIDEPLSLGGTDAGPNPVETVLAALGTCQAITYRVWAAMLGIRLDEVRFETEGDLDLSAFLGIDDSVRPGLGEVRHRVILIGPETEERYRELTAAVDRHCPVLDIVENPVPVERTVEVRRT